MKTEEIEKENEVKQAPVIFKRTRTSRQPFSEQ